MTDRHWKAGSGVMRCVISVTFSGALNLNSGFEFQSLASVVEQVES